MSSTAARADPQAIALALRVLGGNLGAAHLWFDWHVLDRYRQQAGWRVLRTNTVGRVRSPEGWQLDFGIADGAQLLHASLVDLTERLPATERLHWAQHLATLPASRTFLTMRLAPGSCIDDGDLREFEPATETQG